MKTALTLSLFLLLCTISACQEKEEKVIYKSLEVTSTAYNSVSWQTKKGKPAIAAWGDTLVPGMKAIAVSRDLIDSGLTHNTKVIIRELNDTFLVKDKMHRRWTKKIDIYMGTDVQKARDFGKKKLSIKWLPKEKKTGNN